MKIIKSKIFPSTVSLFTAALLVLLAAGQEAARAQSRGKPLKEIVLENGLRLIYEHDASSQITVIQFFIKGGQRAEPPGKAGLAYLTTRLALEIPDFTQTQKLMNQATGMYMACQEDCTFITLSCLSENLEESLELVSKIMRNPLMTGIRIDRITKQMEDQLKTEQDDSVNLAHSASMAALFKDTPYASSVFGTKDSLKAIKKSDITWFYRHFFHAGNMLVVVTSDLEEKDIKGLIDAHYGPFPNGPAPDLPSFKSRPAPKESIFQEKDKQQSFVSAAFALNIRTRREYALSFLLDCLLGKGIHSRLWDLRVRQKLAYSVQSRLTHAEQGTLLEAFLETEHSKTEKARDALQAALLELHEKGIDSQELEMTKNYAKAQILRDNETKVSRSRTLAFYETVGLGYTFLADILEEIDSVTLDEMNGFIRSGLAPQDCLFVIIGPAEDEQ
ncbi:MAG: pitrilysin family protein [Candidatus Aminicenantaceae bacterium]